MEKEAEYARFLLTNLFMRDVRMLFMLFDESLHFNVIYGSLFRGRRERHHTIVRVLSIALTDTHGSNTLTRFGK